MGLYEVPLFVSLLGFWDRDYVSQLPCVRYCVFVKSSFKHTREDCKSKCTEMLWMCMLYVSLGSKVRPRTFGCIVVFFMSTLLVYSAGSGMNKVQVVLSGFSVRLFCFVQAKTFCTYGCIYFLAALVLVCVDVIVMSSA